MTIQGTLIENKNGGGTIVGEYDTFTWDGVFNLTSMDTPSNPIPSFRGVAGWTYDTKDRLTQETSTKASTYTENFAYDSAGNPTTFRNASPLSYNNDSQLTGTGFTYDGNGNPTVFGGLGMAFDVYNRLSVHAIQKAFTYRADGLRAWKGDANSIQSSGNGTYYYYDRGQPVFETSGNGTVTAINVFAPDGLVARKTSSTWAYYQFDQQGSVAHRSNAAGGTVSNSCYNSYGLSLNVPGPNQGTDPYGWNARWGYYRDYETGLILCQQRYYHPTKGRWLNRDPIGYAGGANLYGYCGGGPIGRSDPSGLAKVYASWREVIGSGNYHALILIKDETTGEWLVSEGGPHYVHNYFGEDLWLDGGTKRTTDRGGGEGFKLLVNDDLPAKYWRDRIDCIKPKRVPYVPFPWHRSGGGNSNSWVREVLERLKLPTVRPTSVSLPGGEVDPW